MSRADPVIEFVGLPGSGKSTISAALPASWPTSRNTDPRPAPLARRLAFYRAALPFMLSLRPFDLKDLRRLRRLAAELRFYDSPAGGPLVIDQGMVQKLWSILYGRKRYSRAALERLMAAFAPSAADLLVVLATPLDVTLARLSGRKSGNARLQRLGPEAMAAGLASGQALYAMLVDIYRRHAASRVLELPGTEPVAASAAQVIAAVADHGGRAAQQERKQANV